MNTKIFIPNKVYFEPKIKDYPIGYELYERYAGMGIPLFEIASHNSIEEFQKSPNCEFANMKKNIILGVRKTHKFVPNEKVSDFLVPYTSSGCTAMCLYCYLVCNYNKCSYLRLFVNREQMLDKIIKTANKSDKELVFEIGSNSDLVLENTITGNLEWTISEFAKNEKGYLTFPTKFDMIAPLLPLEHRDRIIPRISVNPAEIIKTIEFKTSDLDGRITAANALADAGYKVGILIAPVVFVENWQQCYSELIKMIAERFNKALRSQVFFEVIFMTYSYVHRMINQDAFPNAVELFDKEKMTGRGRGKYWYKEKIREEGAVFFNNQLKKYFPKNEIVYIV